jgi:hypothetical protein
MPSLFVKCEKCGEEFPSMIAVTSAQILQGLSINGLQHTCPKCGTVGQFFTKDYFIPGGIEKATPDAPAEMSAAGGAQAEESMKMSGYGVGAR